MALRIWLPLNGSLENKGISDLKVANIQSNVAIDNNGKIGKCYTNSGTTVSTVTPISISSNTFSMSAWVKLNTRRNNWCRAFGVAGDGTYAGLACEHTDGSKIGFHFYKTIDGTNTSIFDIYPTTQSVGEWVHWAMCYDGIKYYIYKNGILLTSNNANRSNINFDMNKLYLFGGSSGTSSQCSLNDVRVYDHCLSQLEVKEISQGLVLHYKLNNCVNDGNDNLLLRTKMDADAQAEFVAGSSTDFTKLFRYYNGNAGLHTFSETIGGGFEDTVALSTTGNLGIAFVRANSELNLDPNSYYTLSCEAKCTSASKKLAIGTSYRTTSNGWVWRGGSNAQSFTGVDTWKTFQYTFKPDSNILYICYCFTVSGSANGTDTFTIRHCKLEKGSAATEWSPAQEEGIIFNKIVDSSGYGNDGILSQRKLYLSSDSKRYNKSIYLPKEKYTTSPGFYFPMLIEHVDIPESTLCLWVKPEYKIPGYGSDIYDGYFEVWIADTDKLNLTMYTTTSYLSSKPHITFNEWNFISLVYKDKILYGYVNGEYIGSFALQDYEHIYPTQIAGKYHHLGSYFVGKMNDIRLYHTALSAEDIAMLYHTPIQVDNLGGIHGFEFEETYINNQISDWTNISLISMTGWSGSKTYDTTNNCLNLTATNGWRTFAWSSGELEGRAAVFEFDYCLIDNTNLSTTGIYIINRDAVEYGVPLMQLDTTLNKWNHCRFETETALKYLGFNIRGVDNTSKNVTLQVKNVIIRPANNNNNSILKNGIVRTEQISQNNYANASLFKDSIIATDFIEK